MRDDVKRALAITDASGPAERTIDVTTTGRRSGKPRRIETWFYRHEGAIYLSGRPRQRPRQWLLNLEAEPRLMFHLKGAVVADLPATAELISDLGQRRQVLTAFYDAFLRRNASTGVSTNGTLDDWVANCPLARIDFNET